MHWKQPYGSHRDLIPSIAECVPLDVVLVYFLIWNFITCLICLWILSPNKDVIITLITAM